MLPTEFIKTIYLGDRALKQICIDGWSASARIKIDQISRIRSPDGLWNFYNDEDITDGEIVISGIRKFSIEPKGLIPNDIITDISCQMIDDSTFNLSIDTASVDADGTSQVATISLVAKEIYLIDPRNPGHPIRT